MTEHRTLFVAALLVAAGALPAAGTAGDPDRPTTVIRDVAERGNLALAEPVPSVEPDPLRAEVLDFYDLVGAVPTAEGLAQLDAWVRQLPEEVREPTARILAAINQAAILRTQALADVTPSEVEFARETTLAAQDPSPAERWRLSSIASRIDLPAIARASLLVTSAVEQARPQLEAAAQASGAGDLNATDPLGAVQLSGTADHVHNGTPPGDQDERPVAYDGRHPDRTLQIDLGGDDVWKNNAGAVHPDVVIQALPGCSTTGGLDCTPLDESRNAPSSESVFGRPCSADAVRPLFRGLNHAEATDEHLDDQQANPSLQGNVDFLLGPTVDAAAGAAQTANPRTDCLPQSPSDAPAWRDAFLSRGILTDGDEHGVAVALDLGGDDRFAPPKRFTPMNNGHNPPGCDTRHMGEGGKLWGRNLTAGGGFTGIGLLWDDNGSDFYGGRSLSQGVGHVGAAGLLFDRGSGNDHYVGVRLDQGAAIFTALGILHDEGGDDTYELKNDIPYFNEFEHFIGCDVSTRDGQGRANFNAIAAHVDGDGSDTYFVQDHDADVPGASRDDPTTTQGSTGARLNLGPSPVNELAALGKGLLWDRGDGEDTYTRPGRGNGMVGGNLSFVDEG